MKSFHEWKLLCEFADLDWENLKKVWGSGAKHVDNNLVKKLQQKIQSIIEKEIGDLNDPKVTNFREMPPHMRDSLAQAIVIATLKAFYLEAGSDATGGRSVFDQNKLGDYQQQTMDQPQDDITAPQGWKG